MLENSPLNSILLTLVTSRPSDRQLQFYIHEADLPGRADQQLQFYIHEADLPGRADRQLQFYIHEADLPGRADRQLSSTYTRLTYQVELTKAQVLLTNCTKEEEESAILDGRGRMEQDLLLYMSIGIKIKTKLRLRKTRIENSYMY